MSRTFQSPRKGSILYYFRPMRRFEGEYASLLNTGVFADLSHWGKIRFAGPDCKKFLEGLLTNDILNLTPGHALHSCVLTPEGTLLGDFELYDRGEDVLALGEPPAIEGLRKAISEKIAPSQTKMEDAGSSLALLYVAGPKAGEVKLLQESHELEILAYDPLAGNGCLVLLSPAKVEASRQALRGRGFLPVGREFLDVLRIERGIPLFGVDTNSGTVPLGTRLDKAISFTKGRYTGQEAIRRIKNQGPVGWGLVRVSMEGTELPALPAPILSSGKEAGTITSAAWSPRTGGVVALAMIRAELSEAGTNLEVPDHGKPRQARVVG